MFPPLCLLIVCSFILAGARAAAVNDTSMDCVDYSKVEIVEKELHTPPLEELVQVLNEGLGHNFAEVSVSAETCPDLTQPPYSLTSKGITGDAKLIELGGPPYLLPLVQRDKVYDLRQLLQRLRRDPAHLAGAGAGPWPYVKVNCEGIIDLSVRDGHVKQGSRAVSVHPPGAAKGSSGYLQHRLPAAETRTALLGNYLLSNGEQGQIIKIVAKNRTGELNFITAIRETLTRHYGDKVVGLGGTFALLDGTVKHHVMPDFSGAPLCSDADVDAWLHYFEIPAPIVHVGTLVTGDMGLDLRLQHFHGYGPECGGHYHYDTSPARAHYEAVLAVPRAVLRIDAPAHTHMMGRD